MKDGARVPGNTEPTGDAPAPAQAGAAAPTKMCPKVILEGTRLTNKTDLAFALNEHAGFVGNRRYRYHSPIISAEWCGFTNAPWGRGLTNFLPEETDLARETFDAWLRIIELQRYYSWIVDRFHVSAAVSQRRMNGLDFETRWIEERLAPLGFHLIVCVRSEASFAAARERRLKVSGNPSQYDDLSPFYAEQDAIRATAAASILPTLELDVSDNDIDGAADRVVAYLEGRGGIYSPDPAGCSLLEQHGVGRA